MEKEWYVVNTYSGHEAKVKEKLEAKVESMDLQDYIYLLFLVNQFVFLFLLYLHY